MTNRFDRKGLKKNKEQSVNEIPRLKERFFSSRLATFRNRTLMPDHQQLSHPIYESLPYLYICAGVLVVVSLPNVFGIFSGLLLLSAGVWVWWARRTYRSALHLHNASPIREGGAPNYRHETGLVQLVWNSDFERGHVIIDTQHRKLIEVGNALLNAILDEKPKLDVEMLFDELVKDVTNHFSTEENLLAQANYPLTLEHQEVHRKLLARCKDMGERYHKDELKVSVLYKFVAHDVVLEHIVKEDLKFHASTG